MAMKFFEKIGNIKVFFEQNPSLFGDSFTVYAINGADVKAQETFDGVATPKSVYDADRKSVV